MEIKQCALIGYDLKPENVQPISGFTIEYETIYVGRVKITLPAYQALMVDEAYPHRYIVAGICKNRTLRDEDPILIDTAFLKGGFKLLNPPTAFEEKCQAFLKTLYLSGGKENKEFELNTIRDFPMAYADPEEFSRIIDELESENLIDIRKTHRLKGCFIHMGVKLTGSGRDKVKASLPVMPLVGLVSQTISTGDADTDEKINHARNLFLSEPVSMDKMRSACEALSYVLEPLREDLRNYFDKKDVSDFFQLVNNFDIRHNKESTKNISMPEQLEWLFYTLLNTINAYTKIKNRR